MQKPHLPSVGVSAVIVVVAIVLYHLTLGKKKR